MLKGDCVVVRVAGTAYMLACVIPIAVEERICIILPGQNVVASGWPLMYVCQPHGALH